MCGFDLCKDCYEKKPSWSDSDADDDDDDSEDDSSDSDAGNGKRKGKKGKKKKAKAKQKGSTKSNKKNKGKKKGQKQKRKASIVQQLVAMGFDAAAADDAADSCSDVTEALEKLGIGMDSDSSSDEE